METTLTLKIIGLCGAGLYTLAYFLLTTGRVHAHARPYHAMNLVASAAVFSEAFYNGTLGAIVVNVIWFAIAGLTLLGVISVARSSAFAGEPDALEGLPPRTTPRQGRWRRFLLVWTVLSLVAGMTLIVWSLRDRAVAQARTIRVYIHEWEPYVMRDAPGFGPAPQLISNAAAQAGLRVEFEYLPNWQEAYDRVLNSDGVATFPWMDPSKALWRIGEDIDEEEERREQERRERRFEISQVVGSVDHVVYVRVDDDTVDDLGSLAGKTICVPRGYQVPRQLVEAAGGVKLERAETVAEGFKKVASGEFDAMYVASADGERALRGDQLELQNTDFEVVHRIPLELHVLYSANGTETFRRKLDEMLPELGALPKPNEPTLIRFTEHASARVAEKAKEDEDGVGERTVVAGTSALVLDWPKRFGGEAEHLRIKPIEGPLAGRVLITESVTFRLVEGDGR